jgi:hypothetical protein
MGHPFYKKAGVLEPWSDGVILILDFGIWIAD